MKPTREQIEQERLAEISLERRRLRTAESQIKFYSHPVIHKPEEVQHWRQEAAYREGVIRDLENRKPVWDPGTKLVAGNP